MLYGLAWNVAEAQKVRQEGVMRAMKEQSSSENDRADSACGGGIIDAHETASRFLFDSHFRNDGDAHSGADHAEKAAELAALKNNLWMQAGSIARRDGGIAEAVAVAQEKKGLGAQVLESKRATLGEFVADGQRGKEALREQRKAFEFVAANRQREYGEVHFAGAQLVEQDRRNLFHHP